MQFKHPMLFAAAAFLLFSSPIPILGDFYGLARTICFIMSGFYLGAMIRVYRLHPIHRPVFWIVGLTVLLILYNSIITIPIYFRDWPNVDLFAAVFMIAASFLSPEAIPSEKNSPSNKL